MSPAQHGSPLSFCIHPNVYSTGNDNNLLGLLERCWVKELDPGQGTIHIVSGFGNFNGGVRFFERFRRHVELGGRVRALFSGSTASRLTSVQLVEQLLHCGAEVKLVTRKRLLHAKLYGYSSDDKELLVVTSGNFTGPGMSQNVEASVYLSTDALHAIGFSWKPLFEGLHTQNWSYYDPGLKDRTQPAWKLLYDEHSTGLRLEETEETTLLMTLSHIDTARIQAQRGTRAGTGSQYFWLSRDCFDFFPPLTTRNRRGTKATFSCVVTLHYCDLGLTDHDCRVTFEAENNLDFRLGTGALRYTKFARAGDLAALSRVGEDEYELRIFSAATVVMRKLLPYAVNFVGHRGKRYGYIPNADFVQITGVKLRTAGASR